jgi:putative glutamine amidotransferase
VSARLPVIGITSGTTSHEGQTPRFGTNQAYASAIAEAGGVPLLVVPCAPTRAAPILDRLDGLLVPGGADVDPSLYGAVRSEEVVYTDPARDALELECLSEARRRGMPVFGICRGMQIVNVVFGGSLHQDIPMELPGALRHCSSPELGRYHLEHRVQVSAGSWFAEAAGATSLMVNSLHHQAMKDVGEGRVVTAVAEDGVIEALETEDRQTVSVQCHLEELRHLAWACGLFESFVVAARLRAAG